MNYKKNRKALTGLSSAVRPWQSTDAIAASMTGNQNSRYVPVKKTDQAEIDACLECPFASCEGTARKCRTFRAGFIAKAKRTSNDSI